MVFTYGKPSLRENFVGIGLCQVPLAHHILPYCMSTHYGSLTAHGHVPRGQTPVVTHINSVTVSAPTSKQYTRAAPTTMSVCATASVSAETLKEEELQ